MLGRKNSVVDEVTLLTGQIAAAERERAEADAESTRLNTAGMASSDDAEGEALLAKARSEHRRARRAEERLVGLRERHQEAIWATRSAQYLVYRDNLIARTRDLIDKMTAAAAANRAVIDVIESARRDLGDAVIGPERMPRLSYGGIALPDLIATWRTDTERRIVALSRVEITRPQSAIRDPNAPVLPMLAEPQRRFMWQGWNSSNPDNQPPNFKESPPRKTEPARKMISGPRAIVSGGTAPRVPDDLTPLGPGEIRVQALGNAPPTSSHRQPSKDQILKLPVDVGRAYVGRGFARVVEEFEGIPDAAE
jgi:hypothetical protein